MFSSFKRLINNFLFPSYGVATSDSAPSSISTAATPAASASARPTSSSQFSSPPHIAERSTKRRRIVSEDEEGSEEEMDEEAEEQPRLSHMSLAELKRRGYSLDEISKIFNSESVAAPAPPTSRYPSSSFATPASRPYRPEISNGANGGSRVPRRGTPFAPPALPRRAAPVGTYTPSLAPYPAPSPASTPSLHLGCTAFSIRILASQQVPIF
jgi:hypothetical protein